MLIHGRGTGANPPGRFEKIECVPDPDLMDLPEEDRPSPKTHFLRDTTRTAITENDSPDVGFSFSVNPYRGCEHGCIYCYARPTHEFLGFSAGLDFETRILVKTDVARLLREELSHKRWNPAVIAMSGVTDCYQPAERQFKLTRACLEVLAEFRNPVAIITKSHLVTRDIDVLGELARANAAAVNVSVTSLDDDLAAALEPRAARPRHRLDAISRLAEAGIPVGVMVAPVIPGLTDHEMPSILRAAKDAGAQWAHFVTVRLPYGVKDLVERWLEEHRPERKDKVLGRVRETRGGKLNDPRFGSRMKGEGVYAEQLRQVFQLHARRLGLDGGGPDLSTAGFQRQQLSLL
jgi:DNA repair photolyase